MFMPGNSKGCPGARAEMAVEARSPQLKATFSGLSKSWEKLAIQLEDAFAQLAEKRHETVVDWKRNKTSTRTCRSRVRA
jgi:hypothetical protein